MRANKRMDTTDIEYVRAVLAGRVASCVCDGDLEPPQGARCRTRSGFRGWLRRAEKQTLRKDQASEQLKQQTKG